MTRLSAEKIEKIKSDLLNILFEKSPRPLFTVELAREVARDEEFVKALLLELESKALVTKVSKNNRGKTYKRRLRWRLSHKAFEAYLKLSERK